MDVTPMRQDFIIYYDFSDGLGNNWRFNSCIPINRKVRCSWESKEGAGDLGCVRFDFDCGDVDGLCLIETSIGSDFVDPINLVGISWFVKEPKNNIDSWSSAIYIGAPKDQDERTITLLPKGSGQQSTKPGWLHYKHHMTFPDGLYDVIVAIGFKANSEAALKIYLDDITILGH